MKITEIIEEVTGRTFEVNFSYVRNCGESFKGLGYTLKVVDSKYVYVSDEKTLKLSTEQYRKIISDWKQNYKDMSEYQRAIKQVRRELYKKYSKSNKFYEIQSIVDSNFCYVRAYLSSMMDIRDRIKQLGKDHHDEKVTKVSAEIAHTI